MYVYTSHSCIRLTQETTTYGQFTSFFFFFFNTDKAWSQSVHRMAGTFEQKVIDVRVQKCVIGLYNSEGCIYIVLFFRNKAIYTSFSVIHCMYFRHGAQ